MQLPPFEQSGLISFHKETAAFEEAKRRFTSSFSPATPQTDFSQAPGLQAAIRTGVQSELKKRRGSGERSKRERQRQRSRDVQASTPEA